MSSQKVEVHSTNDAGGNIISGREDGNNDLGNGSTYQIFRNDAATNSGLQQYFAKDKDGVVEPVTASGGGLSSVTHDDTLAGAGTVGSPLKLPYKTYVALLTQSGTNPPVATVLENSFGATLVWTRGSQGVYRLTLAGAFPDANKVWNTTGIDLIGDNNPVGASGFDFTVSNANSIQIDTFGFDGVGYSNADGLLNKFPIEIRVYP